LLIENNSLPQINDHLSLSLLSGKFWRITDKSQNCSNAISDIGNRKCSSKLSNSKIDFTVMFSFFANENNWGKDTFNKWPFQISCQNRIVSPLPKSAFDIPLKVFSRPKAFLYQKDPFFELPGTLSWP
jgi:hypothetical protein